MEPAIAFDCRNMFQVIPPCGGIQGGRGRCCCRSVCFKSYPLAGVFSKLSSCASAGTSFQVIPPCGGILGNNTAITAISIQFQVIPPCGGIPACYPAISANSYTSFKSYPLAGVFCQNALADPRKKSFKSYPLAGVFHGGAVRNEYPRVSSHTPLRGYSSIQPSIPFFL